MSDDRHRRDCGIMQVRQEIDALKSQIYALDGWVKRQDSLISDIRIEMREVRQAVAESRQESHGQFEALGGMLREVLVLVRPATDATCITPAALVSE